MRQIKGWQQLSSLGLEFWLPLPIIGIAFWIASGFVTDYSLGLSGPSVEPFTIALDKNQPSEKILFIKVSVDKDLGTSQVNVKQATQVYRKQQFELNTTNREQMEAAIGRKLNLSPEEVRRLLRYQVKK
ncbi:hypothetical protein C1752_00203 [Acaryochloris thomasi RCC1774]|uniref:Uncharacterized protein n=1 Tax=Acaryochloris thomasi RCC1774 TaxID=1764569 RepID=A0A2W1K7F2_9CYAN|nr:hypothetical protein [Acaryochloris thomasi]PZD75427.1 hypothetical protein C1752_00203 [Acaryochloris thomasi RCC1774]